MSNFQWKELLTQWSREVIESGEFEEELLPAEVRASGWLGYPGATETQLLQAEARLGMALPPSYREFLVVSNGWRITTNFIWHLWSAEEIDWLPVRNADLANIWASETMIVPDEKYFVYGEEQDCIDVRGEYFPATLEISDWGDSAIYLLNPKVITAEGEWEAWSFANWNPGASRYPSFWEMMQEEHKQFLDLLEEG